MRTYYTKERARFYNQHWKVFSEKTHMATLSVIDFMQLEKMRKMRERPLHILDVACGTGLLLKQLAHFLPSAELYGIDESEGMLHQARLSLEALGKVHIIQASLQGSKTAGLPYEAGAFDLITCTNALHNIHDPIAVLQGLTELLTPHGQFVLEDYARRTFPFPWRLFEWFTRRRDPQHVRAYTLSEAQAFCQEAGLHVSVAKNFPIDRVWRGWVICASVSQEDNAPL